MKASDAARLLLSAWAGHPELAPTVAAALDHYAPDQKADLGVFSIPIAIGLAYVLITGNVKIDFGWCSVTKEGLSSADQKDVASKIVSGLASAMGLVRPPS
jgi:hypothetical protein